MTEREKVIKELESLRDICNAKSNMATGNGKIAWAGYANAADYAVALLKAQEPRVLKWEEILQGVGCGWIERYIDGDPENGVDPFYAANQCAWAFGNVVNSFGTYTRMYMQESYGKEHGCRIWTEKPTEAEWENAPWGDEDEED